MTSATPETRQQRRARARQEAKAFLQAQPRSKKEERQHRNAFKRAKEQFAEIRKATEAQFHLGPMAVRLAMMQLAAMLGTYVSRGKGRGKPARRYGNEPGAYSPHQGRQECLRRVVGGWAFAQRLWGTTKAQGLAQMAKAPTVPAQVARNALREEAFA
jgi:hypothetical protein